MQVTRQDIDQLNATLLVTVEPQDYQEKVEKQLKDIRRKANIPGFRPGMVPMSLVKKMYGKAALGEQVNELINDGIFNYIKEQDLKILAEPMPNEEKTPDIDWDNDTTFTFAFDIALEPEFDAKLNGHNHLTYYEIEVTDKMVDDQMTSYAERFGIQKDVDEYTEGDILRGTLTEQAENGIVKENAILSPMYMKSEEQKQLFASAKKGDIITFNPSVAYDSDVELSSMLGIKKEDAEAHKGEFTLTINSISHHEASPLDAELFAKVYGADAPQDLDAFRAKVKEEMQNNLKQDQDYRFGLDAKAAVLKKIGQLEYPEEFLKNWLRHSQKDMTEEKLQKEFPQMLEQLTWQLAKDQLTKAYDIKIENDDIVAYAKNVARMQFMQYGLSHVEDEYLTNYANEMMKNEDQLRSMIERVQEEKVYEGIKAAAKVETKTISYEDFGKLFEQK